MPVSESRRFHIHNWYSTVLSPPGVFLVLFLAISKMPRESRLRSSAFLRRLCPLSTWRLGLLEEAGTLFQGPGEGLPAVGRFTVLDWSRLFLASLLSPVQELIPSYRGGNQGLLIYSGLSAREYSLFDSQP